MGSVAQLASSSESDIIGHFIPNDTQNSQKVARILNSMVDSLREHQHIVSADVSLSPWSAELSL
jgi:hypothetical protein